MIDYKSTLSKFVSALHDLSVSEMENLMSMMRNVNKRNALIKMMKGVLEVRRTKSNYNSDDDRMNESSQNQYQRYHVNNRRNIAEEELRELFFNHFNERNRYPSTFDVVNILNNAFSCGINYDKYRKRGRRDAIKYCWSYINKLPNSEKIKVLKNYFQSIPQAHEGYKDYLKLFKMLTSRG